MFWTGGEFDKIQYNTMWYDDLWYDDTIRSKQGHKSQQQQGCSSLTQENETVTVKMSKWLTRQGQINTKGYKIQ